MANSMLRPFSEDSLPYLTADLPGVGGTIKQSESDFLVEEIPLYEPSGQGTHVYFGIEKQGIATMAAARTIARALGKRPADIGYAGLKDARAITRQTLSVEHVDLERVSDLELDRIKILWTKLHTNKLKTGHLKGNRFTLKIRDVGENSRQAASVIMELLTRRGVPNYFGSQRFGMRGTNALIGVAVLQQQFDEAVRLILDYPRDDLDERTAAAIECVANGNYDDAAKAWPGRCRTEIAVCRALAKSPDDFRRAWMAVDHNMRKLYLSAAQSELFNRVLAADVERIDRLGDGDIAYKHANGACFVVEDAKLEQPRCDGFEISPTGPMFGNKCMIPSGLSAKFEEEVLNAVGLERSCFDLREKFKLQGARRPLRIPLDDAVDPIYEEDDEGAYLKLSFSLPAGSYATCVAREICKTAISLPD